nr:MAG TPA: Non-classical export protein 1 [Caudoviricetes sp.]
MPRARNGTPKQLRAPVFALFIGLQSVFLSKTALI